MTTTTDTDLAVLRALAEEGRHTPLAGGRFLVFFGALVAVNNALFWALDQLPTVTQSMKQSISLGVMILFGTASGALIQSVRKMPRHGTVLAKVEALVWGFAGAAIAVYTAILVARGVLGLTTPVVLLGTLGVVAFLHYAVAFLTTAYLSRQTWLKLPGYGSFGAAAITGLLADSSLVMPVTSALVVLLVLVPGIILMRAERRA
jgi:hypothetical protein